MKIRINKKVYKVPITIEDITIENVQGIYSLYDAESEDVKSLIEGGTEDTWSGDVEALNSYIDKVIIYLSDITAEVIAENDIDKLRDIIYDNIIRPTFSLNYNAEAITSFEFEGETYYLPKSDIDLSGKLQPAINITALQKMQCFDLLQASKHPAIYMPLMVAILCLKDGEKYSENNAKERAKRFKDLPANILFEVFFCLSHYSTTLNQSIQIVSIAQKVAENQGLLKQCHLGHQEFTLWLTTWLQRLFCSKR